MRTFDFLKTYHNLIASSDGEGEFAALRMLCPGLSTPKLGKILNNACRYLEGEEIYCEIGTFTGYTLIAASMANSRCKFVGIDNFRLLGENTTEEARKWARERLAINMGHFKFGNHRVIDSDYKLVDLKEKIGVFYIDGHHTREEAFKNFEWGHEKLSDNAMVFIDDISVNGVGDGVEDWVKAHPDEYREVFRCHSFYDDSDRDHYNSVFWNGLSIVSFKRNKKGESNEQS